MHAYMHAPMHDESVYIYISLLISRLVSTCIRCIYVSLSHACVIVPLYSFVSFPKTGSNFFYLFIYFPFRISLFFVFTRNDSLFSIENACLNVDLMGATTTVATTTTTTTTTTLLHLPIFRFISAIEKDNVVLRDKKLVRFDGKKQKKKKKTHTKKRQVLLCICGILRQIHAVKIRQRQVVG